VRGKYGRRGRSGDPEYGIKNLLTRNLEHLTPQQFAKLEARMAFRNPANQRGRVRIACTRGTRRRTRTATGKRTHPVTGPPPNPGYVTSKAQISFQKSSALTQGIRAYLSCYSQPLVLIRSCC
jgi:hypothetical protein